MGYHHLNQTKILKGGDSIPAETLLALRRENRDFGFFAGNSPVLIKLNEFSSLV